LPDLVTLKPSHFCLAFPATFSDATSERNKKDLLSGGVAQWSS
jgi:hypothetical protein